MDFIDPDCVANSEDIFLFEELKCPIDLAISKNMVMCSNCEKIFCKKCINDWMNKSKDCPICKGIFNGVDIKNSILQQQIQMIKLFCPNKSNGCNEEIPIDNYENHVKNLCNYRPVSCSSCNKMIPEEKSIEHLINQCEGTKILCEICNNKIPFNESKHHIASSCEKSLYDINVPKINMKNILATTSSYTNTLKNLNSSILEKKKQFVNKVKKIEDVIIGEIKRKAFFCEENYNLIKKDIENTKNYHKEKLLNEISLIKEKNKERRDKIELVKKCKENQELKVKEFEKSNISNDESHEWKLIKNLLIELLQYSEKK